MPGLHDYSDEDVARAVQNGQSNAFQYLIERYEVKIGRYARKFLASNEDRKDLIQEVFLKAYVNIRSFDVTKRFSPWLYRIAHNEFINALRKSPNGKIISFDAFDPDILLPLPPAKETADDKAHYEEMRATLDSEFQKLDQKYREVLVLYYFEEMNYKEISDILQIPVATVGVRLSRGKASLKKVEHLKDLTTS